jgi:hypothetical protein
MSPKKLSRLGDESVGVRIADGNDLAFGKYTNRTSDGPAQGFWTIEGVDRIGGSLNATVPARLVGVRPFSVTKAG